MRIYNRKRLDSIWDYRPPEKFENLLVENASQKYEKTKTLFVWPEGVVQIVPKN